MYCFFMINYVVYFMLGFVSCLIWVELMKRYNKKKR